MVELSSNSTTASAPDGLLHASSKLKNSEPLPLDSFDSKPVDYSFADSFLDYDSLTDWIDEFTSPVMADAQTILPEAESHVNQLVEKSVPIVGEIQPIAQAEGEACGKSTDLNCIIEEGMSKVSLVIDGGSTGNIESDSREDDDDSDVESEGTSSASTSSDSSSSSGSSDDEKDEEESSSSSSSGDSSCDDDVETEENSVKADVHTEIGELEEGEISDADNEDKEASADDMVAWDGDGEELDEEEEAGPEGGPISSKNELKVLPPVPQVHATLQPHHQMVPVGVVLSIIGSQVIVEGVEKHNPLNEGSILWLTVARSPLGLVDEIFGPVKNPYYSVRYNSESEVPTGISSGTHVSFVLEFADYVLNNKDLYKKGYDASGANDEEVSDNEFSDDEKELEFKKMQKLAKRGMNDNQQINENRNNARKKKNNAKARKFGQRTFETPQEHDKSRNYGQAIPQQATVPEGSKFDQPAPQQVKMDMAHSFSNQNQHTGPPLAPFVYHGGYPNPSASEQRFINGPGVMPSFPPAFNPCFPPAMNGIRPAEMPFQFQQQQQQQNPLFPNGLPMTGMPWLLQNPVQQVPQPQMPMMNTFAGAPYPPGFVGTSSALPNPLTAVGAQGIHSGGVQFGQNQNMHPPTQQFNRPNPHPPVPFQGNVAPEQFNQGSSSNRGRKSYGRGGPHFRGRRGGGRQPR